MAVRQIKREAQRRIELLFPPSAQMNAIRAGLVDDPRFAGVDAIRAASNQIEASLTKGALPTRDAIRAHDFWPNFEEAVQ